MQRGTLNTRFAISHDTIRIVLAGGGHEHVGAPDAGILLVTRVAAVAVE